MMKGLLIECNWELARIQIQIRIWERVLEENREIDLCMSVLEQYKPMNACTGKTSN